MGNKTFHRLYDFIRHDCDIEVQCRCGRKGVVSAQVVYAYFTAQRWPDSLHVCGKHFWCSRCHQRGGARFVPCPKNTAKAFPRWGPQSDQDLKRLTVRLRG